MNQKQLKTLPSVSEVLLDVNQLTDFNQRVLTLWIKDILEKSPKRIIYVSCNPASQARDIALLCNKKYELKKLCPIDMFPHTPHVENVATLILK